MEEVSRDVERGRVAACPVEMLPQAWPIVRDWLEAALAHAAQHEMHIDEVRDRIAAGDMLLLLLESEGEVKAAAVLEQGFRAFDHEKYVALVACGGTMLDDWISPLVDACVKVGRAIGAVQIIVLGRNGWERILRRYGLRKRLTLMTLEI